MTYPVVTAASVAILEQLEPGRETARRWVVQADVDDDTRAWPSSIGQQADEQGLCSSERWPRRSPITSATRSATRRRRTTRGSRLHFNPMSVSWLTMVETFMGVIVTVQLIKLSRRSGDETYRSYGDARHAGRAVQIAADT